MNQPNLKQTIELMKKCKEMDFNNEYDLFIEDGHVVILEYRGPRLKVLGIE